MRRAPARREDAARKPLRATGPITRAGDRSADRSSPPGAVRSLPSARRRQPRSADRALGFVLPGSTRVSLPTTPVGLLDAGDGRSGVGARRASGDSRCPRSLRRRAGAGRRSRASCPRSSLRHLRRAGRSGRAPSGGQEAPRPSSGTAARPSSCGRIRAQAGQSVGASAAALAAALRRRSGREWAVSWGRRPAGSEATSARPSG
jgi:hypothetical protein